ncbi:17-beta-hydroxysteroid dehydrogenase 14-like [Oppia nitens]|uniref:17-beta-hydroxysteroid dehydrogenase 14-like n=1 Tax=Oppia nitens TaxID=1686743 RepID=UPI0023DAFEAE|nr:17-beta-hydroxysteroid dehydrogenase 14-like [Oppia nitens]
MAANHWYSCDPLCLLVSTGISKHQSADKDDVYRNVGQTRNFTGKVVLVTGSTSGIGEGIVKLFSHFGAHVVITGRNATELKRVTTETQALSPLKLQPLAVLADVTKSNDLSGLLNETIKQFGKLDVLVNNAGAGTYTSARAPDFMKVFDRAILLNLRSYAELSHLAIPYLDATNGTIISISSISSMVPVN